MADSSIEVLIILLMAAIILRAVFGGSGGRIIEGKVDLVDTTKYSLKELRDKIKNGEIERSQVPIPERFKLDEEGINTKMKPLTDGEARNLAPFTPLYNIETGKIGIYISYDAKTSREQAFIRILTQMESDDMSEMDIDAHQNWSELTHDILKETYGYYKNDIM